MAEQHGMIEPFVARLVQDGVISYGLSSYGYDVRLAEEFRTPRGALSGSPLDPKAVRDDSFEAVRAATIDVAPGTFVLGRTVEYLRIPLDVLTLCTGKSSYARCGILVNVTPFEPAWEGFATLCIVNVGGQPVRLYAGEGIAQVLFFRSDTPCETSYADRAGRYQAQQDITPTRMGGT
jgi:dCTP deaminase